MTPRLVVCHDPAERAAAHVAAAAREVIAARESLVVRHPTGTGDSLVARTPGDSFHVAFSGGKTPARMFEILSRLPLPWDRLWAWQVDERVAPVASDARNATGLYARLPVLAHARPIPVDPVADPSGEGAAREYAQALGAATGGVLDLVHLGLGDDGHTASLFPGDPALDREDVDVVAVGPQLGHRRVTLTFAALRRAREIVFLVTGSAKRRPLAQLLAGDASIPAGRLRHPSCLVYADAEAAP